MQIVKSTKSRNANGKLLLEGERLIFDAMKAGLKVESIFVSSPELLGNLPLGDHPDVQLYQVHKNVIQLWSELTTSPGIAGTQTFRAPTHLIVLTFYFSVGFFDFTKVQDLEPVLNSERIPLTLICDNIRDPGNMGSILRSAAAIGCKRLITTPGISIILSLKTLK